MATQPRTPRREVLLPRSARKTDRTSYSVDRPSVMSASRSSYVPAKGRTVKDLRPLGDKAYKAKEAREIVAFLREHAYPGVIEERNIRDGPNRKDFFHVVEFLHQKAVEVHLVWQDADQANGLTEDGVVKIFKQLKYPYTISATFLKSVNAPGTWPTVLAALHWFYRLISAASAVDCTLLFKPRNEDRPSLRPFAATPPRLPHAESAELPAELARDTFHHYVVKSYEHFLDGYDDFTGIDEELHEVVTDSIAEVEKEYKELIRKKDLYSDSVRNLENSGGVDEEVMQKGEDAQRQIEKMKTWLRVQDNHLTELERAAPINQQGLTRMEEDNQKLDDECNAVAKQVDTQEWTAEEVARLRSEQKTLQRAGRDLQDEQIRLTKFCATRIESAEAAGLAVVRSVRQLHQLGDANPTSEAVPILRGLRVDLEAKENESIVGVKIGDVDLALREQLDETTIAVQKLDDAVRSGGSEVARLESEGHELTDRLARAESRAQHQTQLHEQQVNLARSKFNSQSQEISAMEKENLGGNSELAVLENKARHLQRQAEELTLNVRSTTFAATDAKAAAEQRLQLAIEAAHAEKRQVLSKLDSLYAVSAC